MRASRYAAARMGGTRVLPAMAPRMASGGATTSVASSVAALLPSPLAAAARTHGIASQGMRVALTSTSSAHASLEGTSTSPILRGSRPEGVATPGRTGSLVPMASRRPRLTV